MSFKMFFLNTFGGIKNTSKIEAEHRKLWEDYQGFIRVEGSDELKSYLELEQDVLSEQFKKKKKDVQSLSFKGSDEEKKLKEYGKLHKSGKIKKYYQTAGSPELKKYGEFVDGEQLKRFEELKAFVEREGVKSDKEKYEEFKKLKRSSEIKFFMKYPTSKAYKNYIAVKDSSMLKRYQELKELVNSEDFLARKSYLEDAKKWEKSEEYQKEQSYLEMKKNPELVNYFNYKDSNAFDFFRNWELVFEDRFEGQKLDEAKWQTVLPLSMGTVGKNFSKAGDLQGFTSNGENVAVKNNSLQLTVNREKNQAMVWSPVGFQEVELDFTAGLLASKEAFSAKQGILEAKIMFAPESDLVDVIYLAGQDQSMKINLLETGKVNRMGVNGNGNFDGTSISGLGTGKFYIFSVEWGNGLTFKINGKEIYKTNKNISEEALQINLASLVIEPPKRLPHHYTVDWVRCFHKKS